MPYLNVAVDYFKNPKVRALMAMDPHGPTLHLGAAAHSAKWGLDGTILEDDLWDVLPRAARSQEHIDNLVSLNLLHLPGSGCASRTCPMVSLEGSGLYVVHDFLEWNKSAEWWRDYEAEKEAERQRVAAYRARKAAEKRASKPKDKPAPP